MTPPAGRRRGRETALASLFFLAATVLLTWPQTLRLGDAMTDLLDAKLSAWIFHWDYLQTFRDPLNLFHAPILHPARYVLAFSENLYGAAAFGFPLHAAGASRVLVYNVLLLLGMFLSGLSAWALARYVTGDALASVAAGLVYAFLPYKLDQLPHIHMQWGAFLCLVFLFLLRYVDHGRRRDLVLFGAAFAWNAITCIQYAFFTAFLVAAVLVLEAVEGGPLRGPRVRNALLAIGVAVLVCLPFAIPYKRASDLYEMRRSVEEMTYFSARPDYFLSAGWRNKLYGSLTARWRGPEGSFFPGLLALFLAGVAIVRLRSRQAPVMSAPPVPRRRRLWAGVLDVLILLTVVLWVLSATRSNLRIGPLRLGDSGRVLVVATVVVLARLAVAFPKRSRFRSLADFLRRHALDRRARTLLILGVLGVLISLGGRTPYYRFLFQSFRDLFRAVRVAARGVVLFQVALAVLAAWGLALLIRGRSRGRRLIGTAAAVAVLVVEYRAFPLALYAYDARTPPVYPWVRSLDLSGAVVELPLGFPWDCEATFRQADHGKPLVNGHSSFAPRSYEEISSLFRRRPIPGEVWDRIRDLEGSLVIFHAHDGPGGDLLAFGRVCKEGMSAGKLEMLRAFPHGREVDYAFRVSGAPFFPTGTSQEDQRAASDGFANLTPLRWMRLSRPSAVLDFPRGGAAVRWGDSAYGWALDDSGIDRIEFSIDGVERGRASTGGPRPDVARVFPASPEAPTSGFGFALPPLEPGRHVLRVRITARDGGEKVLEVSILAR